jgi:hypothetical protein
MIEEEEKADVAMRETTAVGFTVRFEEITGTHFEISTDIDLFIPHAFDSNVLSYKSRGALTSGGSVSKFDNELPAPRPSLTIVIYQLSFRFFPSYFFSFVFSLYIVFSKPTRPPAQPNRNL